METKMEPPREVQVCCMLLCSAFMALIMILWQQQLHHLMTRILNRRRQLRLLLDSNERFMWRLLDISSQQAIHQQLILHPPRRQRRFWQKERCSDWWDKTVKIEFTDEDWLETFRMSRRTFEKLCESVAPYLSPDVGSFREPVPLPKRVAIVVYKLANNGTHRFVAYKFGVNKSTVACYIKAFCNAVTEHLLPQLIQLPDELEAQEIAARFEEKFKIPQIMGCLDTRHIPIAAPTCDPNAFFNNKSWASYVLQAVVDDQYRFRDISCKMPGSTHEARVLKESTLYKNAHRLPQCKKTFDDDLVPLMFVGNAAHPLLPWLVTEYTETGDNRDKILFNSSLNEARHTASLTFRRLISRWKILQKRMDVHFTSAPRVIAACCALHNFIDLQSDHFLSNWYLETEENENMCLESPPLLVPVSSEANTQAASTRTVLKNYAANTYGFKKSGLL